MRCRIKFFTTEVTEDTEGQCPFCLSVGLLSSVSSVVEIFDKSILQHALSRRTLHNVEAQDRKCLPDDLARHLGIT